MLTLGIHMALRATELCGLTVGDVYDGVDIRTYVEIRLVFYNASALVDVRELVLRYAAFNPHGGFSNSTISIFLT